MRNSRHMSEASRTQPRTPLEIGVTFALAALGVAALVGLVAVFDAENVTAGFGRGFGIAFAILLAGGTIAAGVACLARRRADTVALAAIAAAGLAVGTPVPFTGAADDELLRLLGASLVLLAALWFGTLAASRLERPPAPDA